MLPICLKFQNLKNEKLLFRCLPLNSLTESGKCFEPFTRGPCEVGVNN